MRIEDVSRFLDHSSLAVKTTYLRRLEGQEDKSLGTGGCGDRRVARAAHTLSVRGFGCRPLERPGCPPGVSMRGSGAE
jgi:hypothetical protein